MKKYGWIKDAQDPRDFLLTPPAISKLPTKVDLRPKCPPVYDQGDLGSCTANAIAAAIEFERKAQSLSDFVPSRLFIYYNERVMEGDVGEDAGAQIRDGIKSVATLGACSESEWPYDISKFTVKPPTNCYADALKDRVVQYSRVVQSLSQMKTCLSLGFPFTFGFQVFSAFESKSVASTGIVPMPSKGARPIGGHAVLAVGYDDSTQRFIVRNSWGASWGMNGYFTLPYAYLTNPNLASDFWNIKLVSKG